LKTMSTLPIIVNDPGYNLFQRSLIKRAFEEVKSCRKDNKARIVSFLTLRKKIISVGINDEYKTSPQAKKYFGAKLHAEFRCIKKRQYKIKDYSNMSIYNVRLNRQNEVVCSKPCNLCLGEILIRGIRKIYYTSYCGSFEKMII